MGFLTGVLFFRRRWWWGVIILVIIIFFVIFIETFVCLWSRCCLKLVLMPFIYWNWRTNFWWYPVLWVDRGWCPSQRRFTCYWRWGRCCCTGCCFSFLFNGSCRFNLIVRNTLLFLLLLPLVIFFFLLFYHLLQISKINYFSQVYLFSFGSF